MSQKSNQTIRTEQVLELEYHIEQQHAEILRLQEQVRMMWETLRMLKWKSADKDNMEFETLITYSQKEMIDSIVEWGNPNKPREVAHKVGKGMELIHLKRELEEASIVMHRQATHIKRLREVLTEFVETMDRLSLRVGVTVEESARVLNPVGDMARDVLKETK